MNSQSEKFKIEQVMSVLVSACRPQIKKRAICRSIIEIGLKTIPKFQEIQNKENPLDFEKLVYRFNSILQKFAIKEEYRM